MPTLRRTIPPSGSICRPEWPPTQSHKEDHKRHSPPSQPKHHAQQHTEQRWAYTGCIGWERDIPVFFHDVILVEHLHGSTPHWLWLRPVNCYWAHDIKTVIMKKKMMNVHKRLLTKILLGSTWLPILLLSNVIELQVVHLPFGPWECCHLTIHMNGRYPSRVLVAWFCRNEVESSSGTSTSCTTAEFVQNLLAPEYEA